MSKLPSSVSQSVLPQVAKTTKNSESLIDTLNNELFGLKYELDEKAKKYRNIIKEKIQKSKYNKNRGSPFLNSNGKLLTLPNIGERTDYDWNALT